MSKKTKLVTLFCAVLTLVLIVAPIASAHHPEITVSMDCNGKVTYTVTAWDTNDASARTFTGVKVYSGSTLVGTGNFNSADNYSFTGSFNVNSSVSSVTVTARTDGTWGDSYTGVDERSASTNRPGDCMSNPTISTTLSSSSITVGGTVHDTSALANASSHPTGTVTYTVYSNNTCTTSYAAAGVKTLNSNGTIPNSNDVTFNTPGDYYWQAVYSGDSNNKSATSPCTSEHLVVTKAGPAISTQASGPVTVGSKIHDVATLSGAVAATGAVTFQVFAPGDTNCSTALATLTTSTKNVNADGNGTYTSGDFTTTTPGTYSWRAFFAGDSKNNAVSGACNAQNESSTVTQVSPTIETHATGPVTVGDKIHDVAILSGAVGATGAVTFQVFAPGDTTCSTAVATLTTSTKNVDANGNGTYTSGDFTTTAPGTYRWRAFFAGDANNAAVSGACNAANEASTVNPAGPAISTQASGPVTVGGSINDVATLSGAVGATGAVTFQVFAPGDSSCSTALATLTTSSKNVDANGNGTYTSGSYTATTPGLYRWRAFFAGDSKNNAVSGSCNDNNETSTVNPAGPAISTQASGPVTVGGKIHDVATLSGAVGATGAVTFQVFAPGDTSCSTALATLSTSTKSVDADGNGTYTSGDFNTSTAGTYRWRAFFAGDANNAAVSGACNTDNESSTVNQAGPAISTQASPSANVGDKIHDVATLGGAVAATGAVTFQVFAPGDNNCSTAVATLSTTLKNVDANGNGTYTSGDFTTTTSGTYRWRAFFAGDANNAAVSGACNAPNESTTVSSRRLRPRTARRSRSRRTRSRRRLQAAARRTSRSS